MSPGVASGVVLAIWLAALVLTVRSALETPGWKAGLAAGIGSAILGLLVLGSKLVSAPEPGIAGLRPNAAIMVLGFIALGAAIGAIGGAISSALHGPAEPPTAQAVLRRLTIATVAAVVPLLIIGGLVTSTNSGMAVPDWPTTYGANMFLFPLGSHVAADVFLEHSHRLFGTLAGLATVALLLATLAHERHRGMRIFTISLFVLVLAQGALGGGRVLLGSAEAAKDKPIYAMAHGILAQIFFALLIAAWTIRSRAFADARQPEQPQGGRLARIACAALAHTTILQLVFGAMYRHFRDNHSLYTHIGFSFVVLGAAVVAASALFGVRPAGPTAARTTRRLGQAVAAIVIVQVGLGWAAFLAGSSAVRAAAPGEAILRTAHQANGAALLAVAVAAMLITRRLAPRRSA
ncbi:MAG: COX15/CtaA family protein [Phycisphaerales bacterium]